MSTIVRSVEVIRQFLATEGYVPTIDEDGDIVFKMEGGNFIVMLSEDDPEYYRIAFPGFYDVPESDTARALMLIACTSVTGKVKCAKVYPVGDTLWAKVEVFMPNVESLLPVLVRYARACRTAARYFYEQINNSSV